MWKNWIRTVLFAALLLIVAGAGDLAFALEANTLEAEIDGVAVTFYLDKAVIQDWGNINVFYISYNPRGEKQYQFVLTFPDSIEPGEYQFAKLSNTGASFRLHTRYYESSDKWNSNYYLASYSSGSGSFSIEERDDSWTHYKGTLDLIMEKGRDPDKAVQANFDFTIGESSQPAELSTGSSPEASNESAMEASVEPAMEASGKPPVEAPNESSMEASVEPVMEASNKPPVEVTNDSLMETSMEPPAGTPTEPSMEASVEPPPEAYTEPFREVPIEPFSEASAGPHTDTSVDSLTEPLIVISREQFSELLSIAGCVGGAITLIAVMALIIKKCIMKK